MINTLGYRFAPNVIPLRPQSRGYWFQIGNAAAEWTDFSAYSQGYSVARLSSEEELRKCLVGFPAHLILVEAETDWIDPISLIAQISLLTKCPVVLLLKKHRSKKQEELIRRAYQAGALDVLHLPLETETLNERLGFLLRLSKKFNHGL